MENIWIPNEFDRNTIIDLFTGPLVGFLVAYILIMLAIIITLLIGRVKLFIKCGQKWWKAIIPFYGTYIFIVDITGLHWAFFILSITMFFNLYSVLLVYFVWAMTFYNLGKKFHRDVAAATIFGTL